MAWQVVCVVVAVLTGTEAVMRTAHTRLSNDLVHIQEIPERIDRLSSGEGVRILILGNSLVREGIDIELLRRETAAFGPLTVEEVYPDSTTILDWLHVYRHFVVNRGNDVDRLVVCFADTQLQDGIPANVRQLAQHYTDWRTAADLFRDEAFSFEQRIEFVLARYWFSFANAERVRTRVLDWVVPYFRTVALKINETIKPESRDTSREFPAYRRLRSLVGAVDSAGAKMVVVAFPVGDHYSIDEELLDLFGSSSVPLIDAREVEGITHDNFPDGYHMDDAAAKRMTSFVAKCLRERILPIE